MPSVLLRPLWTCQQTCGDSSSTKIQLHTGKRRVARSGWSAKRELASAAGAAKRFLAADLTDASGFSGPCRTTNCEEKTNATRQNNAIHGLSRFYFEVPISYLISV